MLPQEGTMPSSNTPNSATEKHTDLLSVTIFTLLFLNSFRPSTAGDTITVNQSLVDGQTLVSPGGAFELGFFSLGGSWRRYVGVRYKRSPDQTVVWVANTETPLAGAAGVLTLTPDGDLAVRDGAGVLIWSTETSGVRDPVLQLLDSGNLVLTQGSYDGDGDGDSKGLRWQSFDHPSKVLLPGMKIGWDLRTKLDRFMVSWKTASDPSPGLYSYRMELHEIPVLYLRNGSSLMARVGWLDGNTFGGLPANRTDNFIVLKPVSNQDEVDYTYEFHDKSVISLLVLTQSGVIQHLVWLKNGWKAYLHYPADPCDLYAACGTNGRCGRVGSADTSCACLQGFVPRSPGDWVLRDWSGGCVRRVALNCRGGDGFDKLSGLKLPETTNTSRVSSMGFDECSDWCLGNCSCLAFAMISGEGSRCLTWFGDLMDIREIIGGGQDLYLRLAASELDSLGNITTNNSSTKKRVIIISMTVPLGILLLLSVALFLWKRKGKEGTTTVYHYAEAARGKDLELPLFDLVSIKSATANFSHENKLGEGGFGPVYKGLLFDGPVAVKRLSRSSGQGLVEFRSEIQLVAKLQHTNLVRLLGCCIEAEEKILIYEYMPNGSLDKYLFDQTRGALLDWGKRIHIIEGITQGLLYLHNYSRLRVIHRDLKASNILLDAELNPKISDFGMARIFSLDKSQVNTNRIVGTYGYMSPEYAMEGLFSVKSDVFSFGVLLLEILSGKRSTGIHNYDDLSLNLLGYAWELWIRGNGLDLMDPSLSDTCPAHELSRCINVALLCVQESAADRPTMTRVASMLSSKTAALATPKQPAFFFGRYLTIEDAGVEGLLPCSANDVSLSVVEGR